jgi:hypothetical protein
MKESNSKNLSIAEKAIAAGDGHVAIVAGDKIADKNDIEIVNNSHESEKKESKSKSSQLDSIEKEELDNVEFELDDVNSSEDDEFQENLNQEANKKQQQL